MDDFSHDDVDDGSYYEREALYDSYDNDDDDDSITFADPGGTSALRAASATNPRNLPCPECEEPNKLTPKDRACGYRCNQCADRAEMGF